MRIYFASLVIAGCSSTGATVTPDSQSSSDAPVHPDAPLPSPDAPQLTGMPCPTGVSEVARITAANVHPDDRGFYGRTYKQGPYTRDAEGDGKADVLAAEYVYGTVGAYQYRIRLFVQGTSGFAAPVTSALTFPGSGPTFNAVGDFNGDHRLDVMFGWESESPSRHSYVYVATQNLDHTFTLQASVNLSACGSSSDERLMASAILDVDRDGKDDFLTTVSYGGLGAKPAGMALLRGGTTNLGSAQCEVSATVTTHPGFPPAFTTATALYAADYDGDGNTDLVMSSPQDQLQYFNTTAASTFVAVPGTAARPTWRVTYATPKGLVNADIKTTGTDVNRFSVGAGGVTAHAVATLPEAGDGFGLLDGVVVGDLNGDGQTDVLVVGNHSTAPNPFAATCDRGSAWPVVTGSFAGSVRDLRPIDVNGDGRTEILANEGADLVIYAVQ
ncbi:hypothetical protein BH11MYX1_BH11MYX1_33010 [soil metagenome]